MRSATRGHEKLNTHRHTDQAQNNGNQAGAGKTHPTHAPRAQQLPHGTTAGTQATSVPGDRGAPTPSEVLAYMSKNKPPQNIQRRFTDATDHRSSLHVFVSAQALVCQQRQPDHDAAAATHHHTEKSEQEIAQIRPQRTQTTYMVIVSARTGAGCRPGGIPARSGSTARSATKPAKQSRPPMQFRSQIGSGPRAAGSGAFLRGR